MSRSAFAAGALLVSILAAAPAEAQECFPNCREGFACVKGACVSACNPPCSAGSRCEKGDCTPVPGAATPAGPPPRAPVAKAPASSAAVDPEPAAPELSAGAHLHNGFYLRLALGLSYGLATSDQEVRGGLTSNSSASASGVGVGSEVLFGGTIIPGLALGGGVETTTLAKLEGDDGYSTDALSVAVYGPFVDWYFDPRRGLHAQLMAGLGTSGPLDGSRSIDTGLGLAAAFGHDWWVSDQWSVGVAGRLQYFRYTKEDTFFAGQTVNISTTQTLLVPSLLATFTYH